MGASGVGSILEATMSCIVPALEGSREVGEIWTLSTDRWAGCEYCDLSSGGTAARFSSIMGGAGADEEGASVLVREEMTSVSSCCWTVRGKVVGADSSRIWEGTLQTLLAISKSLVSAESVP